MPDIPLVVAEDLHKEYEKGLVKALRGVSFRMEHGEVIALMGPSGCGKTTLLSVVGLLDRPTKGRILVGGKDLGSLRNHFDYRAKTVGFVFQFHHLLPTMTLVENVEAPMYALDVPARERRRRAIEMLEAMGIGDRAGFLPSRVSGGERQRAAVARALINNPRLVLADEPTGNLDSESSRLVFDLLLFNVKSRGISVLLATHNRDMAMSADRIIEMKDGKLLEKAN